MISNPAWDLVRAPYTDAQIELAREKYKKLCARYPEDMSDFCSGLEFVMMTYAPMCWKEFFE